MANALEKWMDRQFKPTREISHLQDSFDRLFDEINIFKRTNGTLELDHAPSCEIIDEGTSYLMRFDMPGVSKDHVKVEIDNNQLWVRAERKEEKKREDRRRYLSEIYYGTYERSFALPGPVDEKKVDAKFENGVLTLTIPKTETIRAKQIAVH